MSMFDDDEDDGDAPVDMFGGHEDQRTNQAEMD